MKTEFNLHDAAEELTAEDGGTNEDGTGGEGGQPATDPSKEAQPEGLGSILEEITKEKEDPQSNEAFLAQLKSLGLVHNGQPISIGTMEEVKKYLQQGFDYTHKTMTHAETVKAKEAEYLKRDEEFKAREAQFVEREALLQETINENFIVESILEDLKQSDPDLFNDFSQMYHAKVRQFTANKPMMDQFNNQFKEMSKTLNELRAEKNKGELDSIRKGWETELTEVQNKHAVALSKLGVSPNWEKVKDFWAKDPTGTMTVEQALDAIHGKEIRSAHESRLKLLETKNKANTTLQKRSAAGGAPAGDVQIEASSVGNYSDILKKAAANY